jgi:hypothetical protein
MAEPIDAEPIGVARGFRADEAPTAGMTRARVAIPIAAIVARKARSNGCREKAVIEITDTRLIAPQRRV